MDFQSLGLWLFVLISCSLFCLLLPHSFAPGLQRDPTFLTPGKIVVLRIFLGHVPECSGTWERDSCSLATFRFSATPLSLPSLFLLFPFNESPVLTFLAVVTPPCSARVWSLSFRVSLSGRDQLPLLSCLPDWGGCGLAPCMARPKPQAVREQPSSPKVQPAGSFPPVPSAQDKGAKTLWPWA